MMETKIIHARPKPTNRPREGPRRARPPATHNTACRYFILPSVYDGWNGQGACMDS